MAYSKTNWVNGQAPALNANNLNKIEDGIYEAQLTADTAESKADALLDRENQKELKSNKITSISAASTDTDYASAKATYTLVADTAANLGAAIGNREQVANKVQSLGSPSSTTYPSTQAVADALDDKMDTYTASGNIGMILASDGSGGIYETSLEDGYIASQDYVDDEVQAAKDYADGLVDSGTFSPKAYSGNGTEVTSGLNRFGFYTKVGNVCFFRVELEAATTDVEVREVQMPVARSSSATRQHAILAEPFIGGYLYSPGAQTPPTPISVSIMNGNHGFAFFLASDQTIHYAQGQILSIEGWYICG